MEKCIVHKTATLTPEQVEQLTCIARHAAATTNPEERGYIMQQLIDATNLGIIPPEYGFPAYLIAAGVIQ